MKLNVLSAGKQSSVPSKKGSFSVIGIADKPILIGAEPVTGM
jgi:hypothetical protein